MRNAEGFYDTPAWKACRTAYRKKVGGLCERCLSKGIIQPGVIVHHKIHLNESNVNDPNVALNFDNLELVCRKCHAEAHPELQRKSKRRYIILDDGSIAPHEQGHTAPDIQRSGELRKKLASLRIKEN